MVRRVDHYLERLVSSDSMTFYKALCDFVDERVEDIVNRSVEFQDSEIMEDWEDLFDVHEVLENVALKV